MTFLDLFRRNIAIKISTLHKGYFDKWYEEVLSKICDAVGEH